MEISSLIFIRNLAKSLINITKGASYVDKEGKVVALIDKDQIAKSKKETRDACSVYMRELVPQARNSLAKTKDSDKDVCFSTKQWNDFANQLGDEIRFIVTHVSATARAGNISEGIVLLAFDEIRKQKAKADTPAN